MAFANSALITAFRAVAQQLRDGAPYAWGHHGQCNCGHLAQIATSFSADEIQRFAHTGAGEWTELAESHCTTTGAPVDLLVQKLMEIGLTPTDIHHLEYLNDKAVLKTCPVDSVGCAAIGAKTLLSISRHLPICWKTNCSTKRWRQNWQVPGHWKPFHKMELRSVTRPLLDSLRLCR